MVAVYELHVHEIIVMGHDDCGMLHTTADSLCRHMVEEGIDEKAIDAIRPKLAQWADPVTDVDTSVCDTVRRLRLILTYRNPLRFMEWSSIPIRAKFASSTMEKTRNRRSL